MGRLIRVSDPDNTADLGSLVTGVKGWGGSRKDSSNELETKATTPEHGPYRHDIDGLRGIAVLAVIAFHLGYLPQGYLGVDVFFVISGFLITGIIYREISANRFSLTNFYLRRTRRIIPLTLFVGATALGVGYLTMLPDDLENLSQSVIATNLFANNILQAITTKNYWSVVNEYKPLMQTWSLGVEEQYYLVYPLVFLLLARARSWLLPTVVALTIGSLALFLGPSAEHEKFYFIQFRFWELAVGGIAALVLKGGAISHRFSAIPVFLLLAVLCFTVTSGTSPVLLILAVALTVGVLISRNERHILLQNRWLIWVGKISFSLYLWHQVVIAYTRYVWTQEFDLVHILTILLTTLVLSLLTYFFVEQPFRSPARVSTPKLLTAVLAMFVITTSASGVIYAHAGVVRDVPELGISRSDAMRNMHGRYNDRVYDLDRPFEDAGKVNVLVVGNSYARDWANILLESIFADEIEIRYMFDGSRESEFAARVEAAEIVFYAVNIGEVPALPVPKEKLTVVGPKNFGTSNGIFYNYRGADYHSQRTELAPGYREHNETLRTQWADDYIDLIDAVVGDDGKVPVFTPEGKFISQDCYHLTQPGAQYFAQLLRDQIGARILPHLSSPSGPA